jgi:hypothetical protein
MRPIPLLAAVFLLASGCASAPPPGGSEDRSAGTTTPSLPANVTLPVVPPPRDAPVVHVPFAFLGSGSSPRAAPAEAVLESQEAWDAFWSGTPPPDLAREPSFARDAVAVVVLGERPNDCYDVDIDSVTRYGNATTVVAYTATHPAPGLSCFDEVVVPYVAVAFERQPNVTFERHERERTIGSYRVTANTTWRLIEEGQQSAISKREPQKIVIEDNASWTAFWANHTGSAVAAPPPVDFGAHRVAAVGFQESPNLCYSWTLRDVVRRAADGGIEIRIETTAPAPGIACAQQIAQPHVIVEIERGGTVSYDARPRGA